MSAEHLARARERIGQVLRDRWLLEQVIGAGGMAAVYQARHRNGARAAIKLLHAPVGEDVVLRERFLREGYLANTIDHPGVARVLDDDADPSLGPFIVMELLQGGSLLDRIERGETFDGARAMMIADQALDVLAAAHRRGIVHRDLKPANLFLCDPVAGGDDPAVKVLDFGIARVLDASSARLTRTGVPLGTPAYMAPEQARGLGRHVDGRADVYALGATLFRLLTGRHVHAGRGAEQIARVATERAPALATFAPHVSREVCAVIDRALQFEADHRHASAEEMQAEVRAVRAGRAPTRLRTPTPTPSALPAPDVERLVESVRQQAQRDARRPDAFRAHTPAMAGARPTPAPSTDEESDDDLPTVVKQPADSNRAELTAMLATARSEPPARPPSGAFPRIGNVPVPQMTPSGGIPSTRAKPSSPPPSVRHDAGAPTATQAGAIVLPPAVPTTLEDTQYRLEGQPPARAGAPPGRSFASTLVEPASHGFAPPIEPAAPAASTSSPDAGSFAPTSARASAADPRRDVEPRPPVVAAAPADGSLRGWIFAFVAVLVLIVLAVVGAVLRVWR